MAAEHGLDDVVDQQALTGVVNCKAIGDVVLVRGLHGHVVGHLDLVLFDGLHLDDPRGDSAQAYFLRVVRVVIGLVDDDQIAQVVIGRVFVQVMDDVGARQVTQLLRAHRVVAHDVEHLLIRDVVHVSFVDQARTVDAFVVFTPHNLLPSVRVVLD